MDSETIKREIGEARQQTAQALQELEESSERWRAERRRLNAEIDKLEGALTEARSSRAKALPSNNGSSAASEESARLQLEAAQSEERLRKATSEWEGERAKLQGEIARLERAMTDLLERANNPMRSSQLVIERLETELKESVEARQGAETELARVQSSWEAERLKMAGELFRLRRRAGPAAQEHDEEMLRAKAEIEQLVQQLAEKAEYVSAETIEQLRSQHASERQETAKEKARLAEELQSATDLLNRERQRSAAAALFEERLLKATAEWEVERGKILADSARLEQAAVASAIDRQESGKEKVRLAEQLQSATDLLDRERQRSAEAALFEERLRTATAEWEVERGKLLAESARLERAGADHRQATTMEKVRLAEELQSTTDLLNRERQRFAEAAKFEDLLRAALAEWDVERGKLLAEIVRLEQDAADSLSDRQKTAKEKTKLAKELQSTTELLSQERQRFAEAAPFEERLRTAITAWELERGKLLDETTRLERAAADWFTERQEAAKERAALAEELQSATDLLNRERQRFAEAALFEDRLRTAGADWEVERDMLLAEVARLERSASDLFERSNESIRSAQVANQQLDAELQKSVEAKQGIETEFAAIQAAWDEERVNLRRARTEIEQLERKLAETSESVSADRVDQIRAEYSSKLQEVTQEKNRLAEELQSKIAQLDQERQRSTEAVASGSDAINAELARVQNAMAEIERLLDDPATELSAMIRKNVERSGLDAYLKGILFALGRGEGQA